MKRSGALVTLLAALAGGTLACRSNPPAEARNRPGSEGFANNYPHQEHGFGGFLKWRWQARGLEVENHTLPLTGNDPEWLRANRESPTLTWIGHSTFLLQVGGLNVLTDPHFSERASPVEWAGPRRTTRPGLALADLPKIDLVFISHNHYDHLDVPTLRQLIETQEDDPPAFYVPLGLARMIRDLGAEEVVEMDWWDSAEHAGWTVRAVPVQHFSARTPFDRNQTLWAGWVLEGDELRAFFAGDTGYSKDFADIRRRVGPVDLALLPIGAYDPRWFMASMHVNPEEAVQIHRDLEARQSVGMHWGTFILTDEPMDEPPRRLAAELERLSIPPEDFRVMRHGETLNLSYLLR